MNRVVSVEHKVEQSLYGAAPAMMSFMRKSHRSIKMLAARKMLSELVVGTEVSKGWHNVIRSGDSISKRELRTLIHGFGETTTLACVLRDIIGYDGPRSMKSFFGGVTKYGIRYSKVLEDPMADSIDFRFDLVRESDYAYSMKLFGTGVGDKVLSLMKGVFGVHDSLMTLEEINAVSDTGDTWSLFSLIEHIAESEREEVNSSEVFAEWKVGHNDGEQVVISVKDNVLTISKGNYLKNYFRDLGTESFEWNSYLVTREYVRLGGCYRYGDDHTTLERRVYKESCCTIVSNMNPEIGAGLIGTLQHSEDSHGFEGVSKSLAALVGPIERLGQLVARLDEIRPIHSLVITKVMRLVDYLLDETKGFKILTETISSMRELTGINQDFTYQYNMDDIRYENIMKVVGDDREDLGDLCEMKRRRAERVLQRLRRQTEPTQELIMKEIMRSAASGEIDYVTSSSSSIDQMWLNQFYGTDDEKRLKLSKGKTCIVDAYDNYYVSVPSSKFIYIYYKDSGKEIREMSDEHQMFSSKSNLVTRRAIVELCCVFKPSITEPGSLTIDPYKIEKNRRRSEAGLIYMLGQRCEDIAEDISRNKVIWDERKIRVSKMRSCLIPSYLKEEFDKEWFMREIVASYIKAGMRYSIESMYPCYAKALGGIASRHGGLEFDIPMNLAGVEVKEINIDGSDELIMRSGKIDLVESKHRWAGKAIYDSKAVLKQKNRITGVMEKKAISGFVGGSDHDFDLAALFRAIKKISVTQSSEIDGLLEEGSIEHKSVQYIKDMYDTDRTGVREIFSKLGYPSPELIQKVIKNRRNDKASCNVNKEADRDRVLIVMANRICKMNEENGGPSLNIDGKTEALECLEANMEEHGNYIRFLAGLLKLGDAGVVDEMMDVFRKTKNREVIKQKTKKSVNENAEENVIGVGKQGDNDGISKMLGNIVGRVESVFIMSEVIGSHPYVVDSSRHLEENISVGTGNMCSDKKYNKEVAETELEQGRRSESANSTEVRVTIEEGDMKDPEAGQDTGKIRIRRQKEKREKEKNRSLHDNDVSKETSRRTKGDKVKRIIAKRIRHMKSRKIQNGKTKSPIEKIKSRRRRSKRKERSRKKKITRKQKLLKNNRKKREVRGRWNRNREHFHSNKKVVNRSNLEEMVKTRRTHFKTKEKQRLTEVEVSTSR